MRIRAKVNPFKVNSSGVAALTGPGSGADKLLRSTARSVLNSAKLRAPVDTGQLRNSHHIGNTQVGGGVLRTEILAAKEYALPLHEGTSARIIRPQNAKALRFEVGGKTVFAKYVNMPARAGRPWLLNSLRSAAAPKGFRVTGSK